MADQLTSSATILSFPVSEVEPQFRLFAHTMPNQVWAAKPDGMLYWISDSALRYAELPQESLLGTGWTQIVYPEDLAKAVPVWSNAIASGTPYEMEFRLKRADGAFRWFLARAVPLRDASGQISGWVGSNTDIDDQKRAVEEAATLSRKLVEAQAELQSILNSAGSAFYSVDNEGRTTLCNTEFLRMLGFENDGEVLGRKIHGRIHHTHSDGSPHPVEDCPIYLCASTGQDAHVRADIFFRKDGQKIPVEYWVRAIHRDGKHVGAICTFNDISERVELENQQVLLARELEHRGKNTLSLVQAIVSQSLRSVTTPNEAETRIGQRLAALAHAHDLLTLTSWVGAPIADILARATHVHQEHAPRIKMSGPSLRLNAKAALSLTLAIHELCTNAVKYGALSNPTGVVDVAWEIDGAELRMEWRERGGPSVTVPTRKGFGSRLVSSSFGPDMGGSSQLQYEPEGFRWLVNMPLASVTE